MDLKKISDITLEHLINPKNCGNICCADGVGMGFDEQSGEFALIYIKIDNGKIVDIKHNTNGCVDTVVAGSLFTEMVKGESIDYGKKAAKGLEEKLIEVPYKQRACSMLVLKAFEASLIHRDKKLNGDEVDEFEKILLDISCEDEDNIKQ